MNIMVLLFTALVSSVLLMGCQARSQSEPSPSNTQQSPQIYPGVPGSPTAQRSQSIAQTDDGGWTSGGGYAPNDQFNPWYVKNTAKVNYCIEIDAKNFGYPLENARAGVKEAIHYWKKEFELSRLSFPSGMNKNKYDEEVVLGTQEFIETPCSAVTDIRIQLGFLTDKQKTKIARPQNYLALTVRDHYDPVQLRGKGFIYFSPVSGPLKPDGDHLGETRWKYEDGLNFKILAIHELGHIFGATNSKHMFMNPEIMSYLATAEKTKAVSDFFKGSQLSDHLESNLFPKETRVSCSKNVDMQLPYAGKVRCLRSVSENVYDASGSASYTVKYSYSTDTSTWIPYGQFRSGNKGSNTSIAHFGKVLLTDKQKVFNPTPGKTSLDTQPFMQTRTISGTLQLDSPDFKPIAASMHIEGTAKIWMIVHSWMDGQPQFSNEPDVSAHDHIFRFHKEDVTSKRF
jgi:hypothetical protein